MVSVLTIGSLYWSSQHLSTERRGSTMYYSFSELKCNHWDYALENIKKISDLRMHTDEQMLWRKVAQMQACSKIVTTGSRWERWLDGSQTHNRIRAKPTQPSSAFIVVPSICGVVQLFEHTCDQTWTSSTTAASTTWTADRTNPLSRVQEDADHNLMYRRIGDVKGGLTGNGPFYLQSMAHWHLCKCLFTQQTHKILHFTACFGR